MSAAVRTALATAASTVDGIKCHPYFVQSLKTGQAVVRLERITYDKFRDGVTRWNVVVMLPQDQAQAEKYIDTHLDALVDALDDQWQVVDAQPQSLNIPSVGVVPVLIIAGLREQE